MSHTCGGNQEASHSLAWLTAETRPAQGKHQQEVVRDHWPWLTKHHTHTSPSYYNRHKKANVEPAQPKL